MPRTSRRPTVSAAVNVGSATESEGARDHVHHQDVVAPADVPARHGCHAGAAAARIDGAGADGDAPRPRPNPHARFGAIFVPLGERPGYWTPKTVGENFEFTPILKPLETVPRPPHGGLRAVRSARRACDDGGGVAERRRFRSGRSPRTSTTGITIDQVIAKQIGQDTVFPSLELATEDFTGYIGGCDTEYSCAYMNTLSWANATTPLPMEINPRVVFERMFGAPAPAKQRLARMQDDQSILDSVQRRRAATCRAASARKDRARLERLPRERARDRAADPEGREAGDDRRDRARRADRRARVVRRARRRCSSTCWRVAYEADLTRVFTFMMPRREPARLPEPRRHRAAPLDVAPRQQPREARRAWSSSTPIT